MNYFEARLAFETDVSDVHAALDRVVLVDTRGDEAWAQGHLPGALHLPWAQTAARATGLVARDADVVTYCWGPGCNGATRGAAEFARLGYRVREMIGGYEYWVREGFPVESGAGVVTRAPDLLTACGC
ncbi:MAG: sulfurtransferase [Actinobacteria bacterium 13_1_20CM_3_71_11]|nr:MAG: sulfurtransferase [Actinobacteria bacterium 13_1_20CM_3_71_11]